MSQYAQINLITPDGEPGRLFLAEPSVVGIGRYNRYLHQIREAIEARYGPAPEEEDETAPAYERDMAAIYVPSWAALMACMVRFEVVNGDGAWHEQPFPWADPMAFVEEMPYSMQQECADAVRQVMGPLLGWRKLDGDEEGDQKKVSATTTWLTSLPPVSSKAKNKRG